MLGLDLDGTILNYGDHTQLRPNRALFDLLPPPQPVVIISNQGGVVFSQADPAKYPSPQRVAERLAFAASFLAKAGYPLVAIHLSVYHPKASPGNITDAAIALRKIIPLRITGASMHVYIGAASRKPGPFMLKAADATTYAGDSPEDRQAAAAAGIPFIHIPRFE